MYVSIYEQIFCLDMPASRTQWCNADYISIYFSVGIGYTHF